MNLEEFIINSIVENLSIDRKVELVKQLAEKLGVGERVFVAGDKELDDLFRVQDGDVIMTEQGQAQAYVLDPNTTLADLLARANRVVQ